MNNIDYNSKKFFILLGLICVVFFIIIMNAFNYLPDVDENVRRINQEKINKQPQIEPEDISSDDEVAKSVKEEFHVDLPKTDYELMLDEISAPPGLKESVASEPIVELEPLDIPESNKTIDMPKPLTEENIFANAKNFAENKQYADALEEYQKISKMTDDVNMIARSYDEIAKIYAINRRYGTALSFATKSYNMAPSTEREVTLARLYYKTGDIDKATKRINRILQRDFANDKP